MKTTIALILKLVLTFAAAWVSFMVFGTVAFWTVMIIAIAGTVFNYLIGDLMILPRFGNIAASILDGILGGALAWIVIAYAPVTFFYMTSVYLFAVFIAIAEFFFHMYLISARVVKKKKSDFDLLKKRKLNYNTESGSELYPYSAKDNYSNSGDIGYRGNSGDNGTLSSRGYSDLTVNSGYNKSKNQDNTNKKG